MVLGYSVIRENARDLLHFFQNVFNTAEKCYNTSGQVREKVRDAYATGKCPRPSHRRGHAEDLLSFERRI